MKKLSFLISLIVFTSCDEEDNTITENIAEWVRHPKNPVYTDDIPSENYEVASDPHVFFDTTGQLWMIYTGDTDAASGFASIKLAKGNSWSEWEEHAPLLFQTGPSGLDENKETSFYRLSSDGKHQIFYIGYPENDNYESQIYLAEADKLEGPYVQYETPIVERGNIAGKDVQVITSPSVVEHNGILYLVFLGWDSFHNVTTVWVLGAKSEDDGRTWSDFEEVDTPIGMEGQLTKMPDGSFCSVRTGEFEGTEAIFYATADHPFGPWEEEKQPIIIKGGTELEVDEVIAPQITFDLENGEPVLFYTGANHQTGWWIMMATQRE